MLNKKYYAIIISLAFLIIILICELIVNGEKSKVEDCFVTLEDYGKYALWFIGTDIYTNPETGWSEKTRIKAIIPIKNFTDDVIGYTFELKTQNRDSGYVFVKYANQELVIAEYSYSGSPLYTVPKISGKVRDVYIND